MIKIGGRSLRSELSAIKIDRMVNMTYEKIAKEIDVEGAPQLPLTTSTLQPYKTPGLKGIPCEMIKVIGLEHVQW